MKILICGDRFWNDWLALKRVLRQHEPGTIVIHGDCRGADKMGGWLAKHQYGFDVIPVPADWAKHRKAAGPIRNQRMLDEHPDIVKVYAFHNDIGRSRGTKDMCERAEKAGVPVEYIKSVND